MENQPAGTTVGTLTTSDPDAGDTHSYGLVAGAGDSDNGSFTISGSTLRTSAVLDYEAKVSYAVRVRTTDRTTRVFEKQFVVSVTNVNEAPSDIALSGANVAENQAAGAVVGVLSASDDAGDTHAFTLVAGTGSTDNGSFAIVGNSLRTSAVFNFEAKSSYSVRVRATASDTLTFEKALTISVSNVNEAPTDVSLSSATVAENQPSGTTVGALSTTDVDVGDTFAYSLVAGTGSTDNSSFTVAGASLRTGAAFNFEAKSSYSIRVRSTDGGLLLFEKALTVSVSNVNEAPSDVSLTGTTVAENQPSGTVVGTLSATDPDAANTHSFSLVAGTGSTDNASFTITGSSLQTSVVFNFEAKSSYSIRVRATDNGALTFEKVLTVSVSNVNEAPTDVSLSSSSLAENQPAATSVGSFSASDPDAADTHSFSLVPGTGSTDNGSFAIVGASLRTNAVFNFEAKSNYAIRIRATDNGALIFEKALTIAVTNVNEAPTDIALGSASVAENQPSGATVGTLSTSDVDAGDTFTYSLVAGTGATDNASFTISGTGLRTAAAFDFETKASYSIRVRSSDSGSLSFDKVFTVSVINVNEAPVNTAPGAQTVSEDTDLSFTGLSVADVDAGTNNVQTTVSAANGTITPATGSGATITGSGTASAQITGTLTQLNAALNGLKYKGTANWNSTRGTETLTIVTNDQGSTGTGGAKSDTDTVGITVSAVNDKPVATAKSFAVQTNMQRSLSGLLGGASDPDSGDGGYTASFTLASVTVGSGSCAGCTISNVNAANGTVDVDPPGGAATSLTINYTITDSGNPGPAATSDPQTITLNISGPVIWFVQATGGNDTTGKGTLAAPFQTIAKVDTVDGASHSIFLYSGSYANGITLNTGEKLVGQGTTGPASFDALFAITPPAGTIARPAIATGTATVQSTVTLANTALVRGLALSTGSATALAGTGPFSGIDVAQVSVTTTTGTAVNLNNAVGSYSFSSISTNGAANGILLDAMGSSTFAATGGSIVGATTRGVDINAGSGSFSYGGTISSTTASGRSVEVTGHSGGTVAFGGAIGDSGSGINLNSNTGATINFTGGMTVITGTNPAFTATGGGTVTATQNNAGIVNTLSTSTATALNVANTTIGASGLTFRSISSNGGTAPGIALDNTGTTGGLTVTGNSGGVCGGAVAPNAVGTPATLTAPNSADCTGGTIQNKTGADGSTDGIGVNLNNTRNVSLTRMYLHDFQNFAVRGVNVTGFTLANSYVTGVNGTSAAVDEGSVNFDNLLGTAAITASAIDGGLEDNLNVVNTSGTLNRLTIGGSTFGFNNTTQGNNNLLIESQNAGTTLNWTIQSSFVKGARADWINASNNSSSSMDAVIGGSTAVLGNTFDNLGANAHPGAAAGGDRLVLGSGGSLTADVRFNTLRGSKGEAIRVRSTSTAVLSTVGTANARVRNNVIGIPGTANSGSSEGSGIFLFGDGGSKMNAAVTDNTVYQYNNTGILAQFGDEIIDGSVFNATITGNTLSNPGNLNTNFNAIQLNSGTVAATDNFTSCVDIGGATTKNTAVNAGSGTIAPNNADIRLRQRQSTTVRLPGYGGANNDDAAVQTYLTGRNTLSTVAASNTVATGGGFVGGAACTQPTVSP